MLKYKKRFSEVILLQKKWLVMLLVGLSAVFSSGSVLADNFNTNIQSQASLTGLKNSLTTSYQSKQAQYDQEIAALTKNNLQKETALKEANAKKEDALAKANEQALEQKIAQDKAEILAKETQLNEIYATQKRNYEIIESKLQDELADLQTQLAKLAADTDEYVAKQAEIKAKQAEIAQTVENDANILQELSQSQNAELEKLQTDLANVEQELKTTQLAQLNALKQQDAKALQDLIKQDLQTLNNLKQKKAQALEELKNRYLTLYRQASVNLANYLKLHPVLTPNQVVYPQQIAGKRMQVGQQTVVFKMQQTAKQKSQAGNAASQAASSGSLAQNAVTPKKTVQVDDKNKQKNAAANLPFGESFLMLITGILAVLGGASIWRMDSSGSNNDDLSA